MASNTSQRDRNAILRASNRPYRSDCCQYRWRFARSGLQMVRRSSWTGAGCSLRGSWPGRVAGGSMPGRRMARLRREQPGDSQAVGMRPVSTSLTACGSGTQRDRSSLSSSGLAAACSSACSCPAWYTRHISVLIPGDGRRSATRAPGRGPQLSLLGQLPLRGAERRLTGLIAQPRGQLPQIVPGRVTVLPDQQYPLPVIDRARSPPSPLCSTTSRSAQDPVWLDHGADADLDERAVIFQPASDYLIAHSPPRR